MTDTFGAHARALEDRLTRLRAYPCAYCGAEIGEHCVSRRTGLQVTEHIDRINQENAAWKREHPNYFEDAARGRDLPEGIA